MIRYNAAALWNQISIGVSRVLQLVIIARRSILIRVFRELPKSRIDLITDPVDQITAIVDTHKRAIVIDSVEFIFAGIVVPHSGIDNDLGLIRSINDISFFIYQDVTVVILLRRAEEIVAGADLAGRILNKVILAQGGFFDQVHPGSRIAVIDCIKAVCGAVVKIQRLVTYCEMPLAFVGARSGRGLDL